MFFPNFTQPQQMMDAWKKAVDSSVGRMEGLSEQVSSMQETAHTRATEGVDEAAKLMKDSMAYQQQLGGRVAQGLVRLGQAVDEHDVGQLRGLIRCGPAITTPS